MEEVKKTIKHIVEECNSMLEKTKQFVNVENTTVLSVDAEYSRVEITTIYAKGASSITTSEELSAEEVLRKLLLLRNEIKNIYFLCIQKDITKEYA